MDHLALASVNADMGDRAGFAGAEEQEIAGSYPALRLSSLELFHRGARYPDAGLGIGVLHQPAAIHPVRRVAAQHIRNADQAFGGAQNSLARGVVRVATRNRGWRRRAASQSDQSSK